MEGLKEYFKGKFKGANIISVEPLVISDEDEYLSDRKCNDIHLVCNIPNRITVEDYCKWYSFFYVTYNPDNESQKVLITLSYGNIVEGYNHSFYPDSIVQFCINNNLKIDAISYICIVKMFYEECENYKLFIDHLPLLSELNKIIIYDYSINCEYFNLYGAIDTNTASFYTQDRFI